MDDLAQRLAELPPDKRKLLLQAVQQRGSAFNIFPLSFAQQRLWFLHELEPDSPVYHLSGVLQMDGQLHVAALQRSIQAIVARHEVLRMAIMDFAGQPMQVLRAKAELPLPLIDLGQTAAAEREAAAQAIVAAEAQRPFDLVRDPLLRATLLRLDPDRHLLALTLHHIVADGWSLGVFARELRQLYDAFVRDGSAEQNGATAAILPALPIQYADYVVWQHKRLAPDAPDKLLATQLDYWRRKLAGPLPTLTIPADRPQRAVRDVRGARHPLTITPGLTAALRALSQREGATLFMTLLAAFQTLLYRYSGQDDIIVGSPVANRTHAELEGLIGCFVNTLALRSDLSGNPPFTALLERVRATALEAYAHQDLPFERLVEELQPDRDQSRTPLFQAMFALQRAPLEDLALSGLTLRLLTVDVGVAKFDLTLELTETAEDLQGWLEYNSAVFDATMIARLATHFTTLLDSIVAAPQQRIADLALLSAAEQAAILGAAAAPALPHTQAAFSALHQLIQAQAARTPDAVAVVCGPRQLSYAQLQDRAMQLARQLTARGVAPGSLVAVCLPRSADLIVALLAVLNAGAAYLPLDPAYPPARLAALLTDSQAPALVTTEALAATLPPVAATLIRLDADAAEIAQRSSAPLPAHRDPDALHYLIYTSGSTGMPKGAAVTRRGFLNLLHWFCAELELSAADRVLVLSSFSFDLTQKNLFAPLLVGAQLHLLDSDLYDPAMIRETMQAAQITMLNCTPSAFYPLVEAAGPAELAASAALRYGVLGGEPILLSRLWPWLRAQGRTTTIVNSYGPTECTDVCAALSVSDPAAFLERSVPIGRPIPGARLLVLDEQLALTPPGLIGELYVGGVGVGLGYLRDAALTATKFVPDPFAHDEPGARIYATGDRVRVGADGLLEFIGRVDHQVKLRGFRIEPGEIEAALTAHPRIREAAAAVVPVAGEPQLVAYIVGEPRTGSREQGTEEQENRGTSEQGNKEPTTDHQSPITDHPRALRQFLAQRLPSYMIPAAFVELERLPLTPNGKLDRRALPAPETLSAADQPDAAPQTPYEALVAAIWTEILGRPIGSRHANFFELGGHSLLATQALARLRAATQIELPLRQLFEAPTVAGLAAVLASAQRSAGGLSAPPLQPRPERHTPPPLSFAQQRLWLLDQLEPGQATYNIPAAVRLHGRLDVAALEASIAAVVARHAPLRTTFALHDGQPVQQIHAAPPLALPLVDLEALDPAAQAAAVQQQLAQLAQQPFDLQRGPLLRLTLLRLDATTHVLGLSFHHIAADGWSLSVFVRELSRCYAALQADEAVELPPLPIEYADYAVWQRAWLQGALLERQLSYWRQQLGPKGAPAPSVLDLPTDRPRPAVRRFRGAQQSFDLPAALADRLGALGRQADATLFMTLLAAFKVLLARYSGQDDILVGSPTAGRSQPETEALIGCFVNTLVLRTDLRGQPAFIEIVRRVREVCLGAYAHQDTPFEQIVEELQPDRDLSHSPLFQVWFVLQNIPLALELGETRLEQIAIHSQTAKFDLMLLLEERADGLSGSFEYDTDLFDDSTITHMIGRFQTLLDSITAMPALPFTELPLTPADAPPAIRPLPTPASLPLTSHQERLWFIDQFETGVVYPTSPIYHNLPLILHLRGAIDPAALERSLNQIIERHAALRTRIGADRDHAWQAISAHEQLTLEIQAAPPHTPFDAAVELLLDASRRPFDLARDLLIRATLLRLGGAEALALVTLHHIIADHGSLQVIARELAELYSAASEGRAPQLPPPALQFSDYAAWQRQLPPDALDPARFYWKRQLSGQLAVLELPESRRRPAVHTFTAARRSVTLPAGLVEQIQGLGRRAAVDPGGVLLAGFMALLQRYARQDEIVVGTSIAGRSSPDLEALVGPIANLVVLRGRLDRNQTIDALLAQVRTLLRQAQANALLPFDQLVQLINPAKDMSRTALFDVLFQFEERPLTTLALADGSARLIETNLGYGKYDLNLALRADAADWSGTLVYNADIYDDALIAQMLAHFVVILDAMTAAPAQPLDAIRLLSAAEERQQLAWNMTAADYPHTATIHGLFAEQAARTPDAIAVRYQGAALTYRELDARANQLAHRLRDAGVGRETLVALCLPRSLELIVATLATLKAGGAYLPLEPSHPAARLRFMLEDAQVGCLVSLSALLPALSDPAPPLILLDREQAALTALPTQPPAVPVAPDNLAYVIYTSGSTGQPKGALIEHRNVVRLLRNDRFQFSFGPQDVWTLFHSYAFDFSVWEMYGALLYGGTLVITPAETTQDPAQFFQLLRREGVTVLNQTPAAFVSLAQQACARPQEMLALRYVIFGGEALAPTQLHDWRALYPAVRLINMYGITETTVHVTFKEIGAAEIAANESNIGRPIPTTTAYLLDERMRLLPAGVPGELYIGGAGVARGYLNRPALSAQKFVANPFAEELEAGGSGLAEAVSGPAPSAQRPAPGSRLYKTGDLAKLLPNGELVYLGRIDEQVQIRGFRVEIGEIQHRLLEHPAVSEAVVLTRTDAAATTQLVAYVVGEQRTENREQQNSGTAEQRNSGDHALDRDSSAFILHPASLRTFLAQTLPGYMIPAAFVLLDRLPLTANGKLDRRALPAPELSAADEPDAAPQTPYEALVAAIWAEVLEQPALSRHANFFELGGHSLLATQVIARLRAATQIELPLRQLFEAPTVADFAAALATAERSARGLSAPPLQPRPERHTPPPLSFAQQRLWLLDQLEPGQATYTIPAAVQLRGDLDRAALSQAVSAVVARHAPLRTTFALHDGQPVQQIHAAPPLALPLVDLETLDPAAQAAAVQQQLAQLAQQPFDLQRGPLLRLTLLRLDATTHVLGLSFHHIAADGWSLSVFVRELGACYAGALAGRDHPAASELPPLPIEYADYAVWQRTWLQGALLERQLSYWRQQLGGAPPVLDLPTDFTRPPVRTFRGGQQTLTLSESLSAELRALSQREGATLFMTLLAAFKLLLARTSGQDDIVVGSPIANRTQAETEALIGFFLNTLVLRTDLSGQPAFSEVVRRVREVCLGAYAHQDAPFEQILDALQPERDLSHTPLFQVFFNMLNFPDIRLELPGLSAELLTAPDIGSKFDLTLYVRDQATGIRFELVYNANLFTPERMSELLLQLQLLLTAVTAAPDMPIWQTSLLTPSARPQLPDPRAPLDATWHGAVHTLFARQARQQPERIAVQDAHGALSYRELDRRSSRIANALIGHGIQPQDVVAVYSQRSAELVSAVLGILKAGAAFMLLDPAYPAARLIDYLRVGQPRGWIQLAAAGAPPDEIERYLDELGCCRLELPRPTGAERPDGLDAYADDDPAIQVGPQQIACLGFTSGSTGTPKGIRGRHGPLTHFLPWQMRTFGLSDADRYSMLSGLAHDPLQRDIFTPLCTGATICIPATEDFATPGQLASWMERERITIAHLTPALSQLLTETGSGGQRASIASLRYVFIVGDVLTTRDVARIRQLAPAVACVNFYGSTETQRAVGYYLIPQSLAAPEDSAAERTKEILPLGRGMQDVQLLVLNTAQQLVGIGELGEIYVRSPHLAEGYLADETLTAQRFIRSPFGADEHDRLYRTGDLGRYRPDGIVEFCGRADQQVKIRGFRIELGEIEAVLGKHPAVQDAIVLAREDVPGQKALVAYVVTKPDAETAGAPSELRHYLRAQLPDYMTPSAFVRLAAMPLTPNGKVDRRALPRPDRERREAGTAFSAPQTQAEQIIAAIWQRVLHVEAVGVHDNFFDLGGNSLQVVQIHNQLREAFSRELPILDLFRYPTIAALAKELSQEQVVQPSFDDIQRRAQQQSAARARKRQTR
jgi:amino acid adenylation domain-containing protein